jgi:hypothetical protein
MGRHDYSRRPKPYTFVQYDPNNYYAQLGVSPLTSTQEIGEIITRKRNEALRSRGSQTQQKFGESDEAAIKFQEIDKAIGSPKKRELYDRLHPQNELLTVQPGFYDRWFDPQYRIELISAWLLEELGPERFLPTPECLHLWAPHGVDPELLAFLAQFEADSPLEPQTIDTTDELLEEDMAQDTPALHPSELEALLNQPPNAQQPATEADQKN